MSTPIENTLTKQNEGFILTDDTHKALPRQYVAIRNIACNEEIRRLCNHMNQAMFKQDANVLQTHISDSVIKTIYSQFIFSSFYN